MKIFFKNNSVILLLSGSAFQTLAAATEKAWLTVADSLKDGTVPLKLCKWCHVNWNIIISTTTNMDCHCITL